MFNLKQISHKNFLKLFAVFVFLFGCFAVLNVRSAQAACDYSLKIGSCEGEGGSFDLTANICFCKVLNSRCDVTNSTSCQDGLTCMPIGTGNATCQIPGPNIGSTPPPVVTIPGVSSTPPPNSSWCNNDPNLVYSNGVCLPKEAVNCNKDSIACASSLSDLLTKIIKMLLYFSGVVATIAIILGGYWYMTSAGNEEQAEKGKKTLTNFFLGLVVIILAYSLVTILSNLLTKGT